MLLKEASDKINNLNNQNTEIKDQLITNRKC